MSTEPRTVTGTPPQAPTGTGITAPKVFWPASVLLVVFVTLAAIFPTGLGDLLSTINEVVVTDLGWYYVLIVTGFVFFSIWAAIAPVGNIVLGKPDEPPEFGLLSWFSMLFAAGMGIGLVFYGVAEPLFHYNGPPPGTDGGQTDIASQALDTTYLHWGLHAWGIYVVLGLSMAYAVHRKGRPVSIRWALEPLFGDRIRGWPGDVIDVIAIIGTLFGVATSLGLGVTQVTAGLSHLGAVDEAATWLKVVLIGAITLCAIVSVVTGVEKGIKFLSNANMITAAVLVLVVAALGPTVFLLSGFVQQIGSYLQNFLQMSFRTLSFQGDDGSGWLGTWTSFYWGWWMSWAPFVGVFIARISRGRTVREFVTGVLLVPTIVTFLWFAVMGGSAIHQEMVGGGGIIQDGAVSTDLALFQMFDTLPLSTLLSVVGIVLVIVFFVTSSDSGSFVVDMIASGGNANPPVWSRVMWAALEGAVAAVLLVAGAATGTGEDAGLNALKTMAILAAVPFSVIMILMCVATGKALTGEHKRQMRGQRQEFREELVQRVADRVQEEGTGGTTRT